MASTADLKILAGFSLAYAFTINTTKPCVAKMTHTMS